MLSIIQRVYSSGLPYRVSRTEIFRMSGCRKEKRGTNPTSSFRSFSFSNYWYRILFTVLLPFFLHETLSYLPRGVGLSVYSNLETWLWTTRSLSSNHFLALSFLMRFTTIYTFMSLFPPMVVMVGTTVVVIIK